MARALLTMALIGACSPALEPGFFRCDVARGCPADWFCHGDGFCYPDPETFVDGGRRDGGAREDGALPDGDLSIDAGELDADFDAGPEPAVDAGCTRAEDCNDGFDCTIDDCLDGACTATPAPDRCFIDGACYSLGDRDPENECFGCYGGTDRWVGRAGAACNASPCHTEERCTVEGSCVGARVPDGTVCEGTPDTSICCEGSCQETLGSFEHCGACFTRCLAGASCRGGHCECSGTADTCPADTWACIGSECRCMGDVDCSPFGQRCDNATGRCVFP